ncbi:MAG TPA: galactose oxidase early set domain-containing protein [Thermoanaerobaculia bacterium]|nr:galactose oxidase early set domain-containing protein [Thermoanaerobaculia bacterium]
MRQTPPAHCQGRAAITAIEPVSTPDFTFRKEIGGKPFYLLHGDQDYDLRLADLPAHCATGNNGSLALIKLPSATHGWENGQHFFALPFTAAGKDPGKLRLRTPNAKRANLPPAYYMLFYVDCKGKPSVARMVRFDDSAREP